ncbi:MAG: hypothetical protein AVDCRST_MAG41-4264, partial [uncultured Corynebacteriales bacterium]
GCAARRVVGHGGGERDAPPARRGHRGDPPRRAARGPVRSRRLV